MKTNFSTNKFIAIIFLVTHANIWSMYHNHIIIDQYKKHIPFIIQNKIRDSDEDKQHSIIATAHNHNNTFLKLPDEIFYFILDHSIDTTKPLKDIIKPALLLSTTCKRFNTEQFLIIMGKACKGYSLEEKNKAMEILLKSMHDLNYPNRRHAALLLTYAGADDVYKYDSLLKKATQQSDEKMIIALFNNNTNPNQKNINNEPTCFCIKNVNIAKIFIKYGADLNMQDHWLSPNILFACFCYNYSPELIEFYINNKVDVSKKDSKNNNLLHALADKPLYLLNIDYIKIGTLLIKAAPELLNELNDNKKTPLDIAQQQLKNNQNENQYNIIIALIKLFEEHGGKNCRTT